MPHGGAWGRMPGRVQGNGCVERLLLVSGYASQVACGAVVQELLAAKFIAGKAGLISAIALKHQQTTGPCKAFYAWAFAKAHAVV